MELHDCPESAEERKQKIHPDLGILACRMGVCVVLAKVGTVIHYLSRNNEYYVVSVV